MIKEYRVWSHESSQGHYIIADSPKKAAAEFVRGSVGFLLGSSQVYHPIHTMLWKTGKDLGLLKMTKQALKFMDYHGDDKFTKYGRKYYKKDLISK